MKVNVSKQILALVLITSVTHAQVAEITLLDATTKQPVTNAEVYYARSLNGTITNDEGKAQ